MADNDRMDVPQMIARAQYWHGWCIDHEIENWELERLRYLLNSVIGHLQDERDAVFEKAHAVTERHSMSVTDSEAHTSTDDEREALIDALLSLDIQGTEFDGGSKGNPDHPDRPARWRISRATAEAWADSFAALRRTEVPEPSAEPTCEHGSPLSALCDYAARYASGETDDAEPKHAAQGEPSDAQAEAEANRRWPHTPGDPNTASARSARRLSFRQGVSWARAAGGVR